MTLTFSCDLPGFQDVTVPVEKLPVVLGRNAAADIRVLDPLASRLHCEIRLVDGEFCLRDLDSTNGTLLNGERISQTKLAAGDVLTIGDAQIHVLIVDVLDGVEHEASAPALP